MPQLALLHPTAAFHNAFHEGRTCRTAPGPAFASLSPKSIAAERRNLRDTAMARWWTEILFQTMEFAQFAETGATLVVTSALLVTRFATSSKGHRY